jgi:glutathione S-transferase
VLEAELKERAFIALPTPTIADVALYAYVARAPEGDVSLEQYPAIQAWLGRIEGLPGFVPMATAPGK